MSQVNFGDLGNAIQNKLAVMKNFKIGKTGQTVDERFRQEHESAYANVSELGVSHSKEIIDECEKYLIKRFKACTTCDNQQIGGGDMGKSDTYRIYLVWN